MKESDLEAKFLKLWAEHGTDDRMEREFRFIPERRFRLDFAFPDKKIGVEIEGDLWRLSGHTSGKGILRDIEKNNLAHLNGWRIYRVSGLALRPGAVRYTMAEIRTLLGAGDAA